MTRTGMALGLVLGACTLASARPAAGADPTDLVARFALVVGNNRPEERADDGDKGTATLRYADDDAVATHRLLIEAGVDSLLLSRLDDDTRRLNPGVTPYGPPRGQPFDDALAALFARMRGQAARGAQTEFLIFYSGHGDVAGGEGYVLLEDRRLMRSDLYELLARSPAVRNHVFVDACKSYFLAFEKGPGGHRTAYLRSFAPDTEPGRLANVGFVLSTSSDRDSHEWERFQGGILSHELRSALRGAADADQDGRVTYAEIGAFLARANEAIQNPRFRPDFLVRPPGQNLRQEVLRWRENASVVRVGPGAVGHIYVENAHGERILDAHPARDRQLTLHVPPERPVFVRAHDETGESVVTSQAPVIIAALNPSAPTVGRRGALDLAFEKLFATAFEARDVAVFERHAETLRAAPAAPDPVAARDLPALRTTVVVTGIAATAAGLALSAVALSRYVGSSGASQVEIARTNQTIHRLNIASIACYGLAGVAGVTWVGLNLRRYVSLVFEPPERVGARGFAVSLGVVLSSRR